MERQPETERSAKAQMTFQLDPPAMIADDALDDHQAQPGALLLGRVEWLKNAIDLLRRNPAAGVGYGHPNSFGAPVGLEGQHAALGHRLHRVFDQVDQRLLDLLWVQG